MIGKAVVARSPSYLLGDIRVLEMVHIPGLEHLGRSRYKDTHNKFGLRAPLI